MLKDSLANGHEDASRGGSWPMGRGWQIPPTYAAGPRQRSLALGFCRLCGCRRGAWGNLGPGLVDVRFVCEKGIPHWVNKDFQEIILTSHCRFNKKAPFRTRFFGWLEKTWCFLKRSRFICLLPKKGWKLLGPKRYSFRGCSHVQLIMLFYWFLLCGNQRIWSKTRASILLAFVWDLLKTSYFLSWDTSTCGPTMEDATSMRFYGRFVCPKTAPALFTKSFLSVQRPAWCSAAWPSMRCAVMTGFCNGITLETDQKRHPQDASLPVVDGAVSPINGRINGYHP